MVFHQVFYSFPTVTINDISIPLKPLSPDDKFLPSLETRYAWYLACYGTANLFELDSDELILSIEKLANWWVKVKSDVN
ncbi:MAG: hypothetical protein AAGF26_19465 [Cyanobacteria bacterium P01_G01_bin.49]